MKEHICRKFWEELKEIAENPKTFREKVNVDVRHLVKRAENGRDSDDWLRTSIGDERIRAVILRGRLNLGKSSERSKGARPRITIEGRFSEIQSITCDRVEKDKAIRVVVQENKKTHTVITVYPLSPLNDDPEIPEVFEDG